MTREPRRTKIICTIGPASSTPSLVDGLAHAGMDAARLNFSHGTHDDHARRAELVRAAQERAGRPLALIADLQGPKLRVGTLDSPRELRRGERIVVVGEGSVGDGELPVAPPGLSAVLRPGHEVMLDDGLVRLAVDRVEEARAACTVVVGGTIESHKGVNVPGVDLPIPSLTDKDLRDLEFALGLGVDYVALSFIRSADDVRQLRERLNDAGSGAAIMAKIEKAEALRDLPAVVEAADAVMVARGDLGVEVGPEKVPLIQKRIILAALERGKPAVTATQMLESMMTRPEPTRAEASDVANAILDGTACVMLSGETAVGRYPVQSVQAMDRIARAVEPSLAPRHGLAGEDESRPTVRDAITNAACDIAELLGARAILVPTFSGGTASGVARHRPKRPIIAASHRRGALQQMAVEWGIVGCEIEEGRDLEDLIARTLAAARSTEIVEPGDRVVITAGTAVNVPGTTNLIRVENA